MYICIFVNIYIHIFIYLYVYTYIYVNMYVYIDVNIYICKYRERAKKSSGSRNVEINESSARCLCVDFFTPRQNFT